MTLLLNIVIILAGFRLAFCVSPRGALFTGVFVGLALGALGSGFFARSTGQILLDLGSCLAGSVPVFVLANRFDGILAYLIIVPLGFFLLLAGGPIKVVLIMMNTGI